MGKDVTAMLGTSAVIFVPDDTAKTGLPRPLMLQNVLGAPLLAWLANTLLEDGVARFFLICREEFTAETLACMPEEAEVTVTRDSNPSDLLHVFLSTAEESERDVTVVAGPAVWLPSLARRSGSSVPACVFRAGREALMGALDEQGSLSHFLKANCAVLSDFDGFYSVDSVASAIELAPMLRRDRMLRLVRQGVEIFDADRCDVEPSVRLEEGVRLLPGAILRGNTIIRSKAIIGPWSLVEDSEIGEGATVNASQVYRSKIAAGACVGPYAHVRDGAEIGRNVKIGNFVEIKNTRIGEGGFVSHLSYLGDADVGENCNFGCGTATVNFDRVEKHRTTVEKDAFIGCHTALVAPVTVGEGAYVAAGSVITEDVPANALAIGRARQSNKRDWAAKHKKP